MQLTTDFCVRLPKNSYMAYTRKALLLMGACDGNLNNQPISIYLYTKGIYIYSDQYLIQICPLRLALINISNTSPFSAAGEEFLWNF